MYFQLAALTLGFLGSTHCIGMCGPLVVAMSGGNKIDLQFAIRQGMYNAGRIYTYVLLGGAFGFMGSVAGMAGFQQWLSIIAGTIVLALTIMPMAIRSRLLGYNSIARLTAKLQQQFKQLLSSRNPLSRFGFGAINGLLPCGLIYAALAGALATGSVQSGMGFMLFFGLGTVPALLMVSALSKHARPALLKIKGMIPVMLMAMGVLLILRGLNLGIPYISPQSTEKEGHVYQYCHRP